MSAVMDLYQDFIDSLDPKDPIPSPLEFQKWLSEMNEFYDEFDEQWAQKYLSKGV